MMGVTEFIPMTGLGPGVPAFPLTEGTAQISKHFTKAGEHQCYFTDGETKVQSNNVADKVTEQIRGKARS